MYLKIALKTVILSVKVDTNIVYLTTLFGPLDNAVSKDVGMEVNDPDPRFARSD
jgi:hypothetical protein